MRKFNYLSLLLVLIFLIANPFNMFAKEKDKKNLNRLSKVATNPASNVVDINNITCWVGSDGFHDWVISGSWNGMFPKGSNIGAIFAEGIVWGGKVSDGSSPLVRVNGNTYGTGCQSVFNPPRVFKVRPDYKTGSLVDDAANFNNIALGAVSQGDVDALQTQYEADWNEWPADQGAPYNDVNKNGTYEPDVDIPGIPGAAQTLFTEYTDALSAANYGSAPIGLKISETYWAYAYTGALGNVIYKKVDIIYTGTPKSSANSTIDSMYIVQWADPDVGTSSDDFAGCDTSLNLGYAYTAQDQDATYQAAGYGPPAVGYDFLQGVSQYTGNPNDSAIVNVKWRKGYKYVNPKPMSSFIYFAAGGNWGDPSFDYTGTLEFYNLMRGYRPEPKYPSAVSFPPGVQDITPNGTYLLDGDPVAGTGKLDGNSAAGGDSPGDRRIMVVNGPITMHLGDTAEVVLAMVGGLGTNNIDAVKQMKQNDITAQIVFDQLFQLPTLPPPNVHVEQLDGKIVLDWGNDPTSVNAIENFSDQGYSFQGYDVYQLPTPTSKLSEGVKLATYDLVDGITTILDTVEESGVQLAQIVETGQDKGIKRYITVTTDTKNQPLHNGQEYYFAVVPYAFNPAPLLPFHALQSSIVIKVGVPQQTVGVSLSSSVGDTITVSHTGPGDGTSLGLVVDPSQTTGDQYKVTFAADGSWGVTNVNTGAVKASGITNQSGGEEYPIVDGIIVKVFGPPPGMKAWDIPSGARRFSWAGGFTGLGLEGFSGGVQDAYDQANGTIGMAGHFAFGGIGTNLSNTDYHTVLLKLAPIDPVAASPWDPLTNPGNENFSKGYRYLRAASSPAADPSFTQWIIDPSAGYPYQDYNYSIPLSAWDMETDPPTRLMVGFLENNVAGASVDGRYLPPQASDGDNTVNREFLFIFNVPYSETPDPNLQVNISGNSDIPLEWVGTFTVRAATPWVDGSSDGGDQFEILANHPNTSADEFRYTAPLNKTGADVTKADVNKVNVFPNPYYGFQNRETSRDAKYITFSHLPAQATLRIFDLSGVLVKTINKNDPTQFTTWNLQNDNGYPVASGVYVVYVDMPGVGATKILKLALVQEEQILKVY